MTATGGNDSLTNGGTITGDVDLGEGINSLSNSSKKRQHDDEL